MMHATVNGRAVTRRLWAGCLALLAGTGFVVLGGDISAREAPVVVAEVAAEAQQPGGPAGFVVALTNETPANRIVVYSRGSDGRLSFLGAAPTGGQGIGTLLESQHALLFSDDNQFLYVANPGSDTVSVFSVAQGALIQVIPSGGDSPVSVAARGNLVYVLNSGLAGNNIAGFARQANGTLQPLAGSIRRGSTPVGIPAEIAFNATGDVLVVTHKITDLVRPPQTIIDTFTIDASGLPSPARPQASRGIRPFGFAIRADGVVVVAEAFNGAPNGSAVSSYALARDGGLQVISPSVANAQSSSCWVALTNDGQYAYIANSGSGTISSYRIAANGSLSVLNAVAASTGPGSTPVDMDLSADGQFLYALLSGSGAVAAFRINSDGSLDGVGIAPGVPPMAGATGLAAF